MQASWYILYVRKLDDEGKPRPLPSFPNVGDRVVHFLGKSADADRQQADRENLLWPKIQDGVRPAWSPDILRMGYAVVFNRGALVKLALKLGIKNPKKMKQEKGGVSHQNGSNRVLTFDDVWIVGADPSRRPFPMPPLNVVEEDWWLMTAQEPEITSPFLAPAGVSVVQGPQRLADVVSEMLSTAHGYPRRDLPQEDDEEEDYSEFVKPLVTVRDEGPHTAPVADPATRDINNHDRRSGIQLFRY